jgi:hypothetical protein
MQRKTMNDPTKQSEYMLLFRGTVHDMNLSPEAMQDVTTRWMAWYDGLVRTGKAIAGQPLTTEGRVVTGRGGRNVADGPFPESKEAVAGYFLLRVDSFDEAVAIARQCPALDHGTAVEVRQVAESCAARGRATGQLAGATA